MISNNELLAAGLGDARVGICGAGVNPPPVTTFTKVSAGTLWADAFCAQNNTFVLSARIQDLPEITGPSVPRDVSIFPGVSSVIITFTPPLDSGSSRLTNYQYSINDGLTWVTRTPASTASPLTIDNIRPGTVCFVSIRAVNTVPGTPSSPIQTTVFNVSNPPVLTNIINGNGSLNVFFNGPAFDGGTPIISYDYSLDNGNTWTLAAGVLDVPITSPYLITDLPNGLVCQVRFRVKNLAGNSQPSNMIQRIPSVVPTPPTITSTVLDTSGLLASVIVNFTPPSFNGGVPVTNYEYSFDNGLNWNACAPEVTTSPLTVPGLGYGQSFDIGIRAVNAVGVSVASNFVQRNIPVNAGSQYYTTPGSYTFTVPGGITTLNAETIGGGGGGAAGQGGCGGGGDGSASQVGPTWIQGNGGSGGSCQGAGGNGGWTGTYASGGSNGNGTGGLNLQSTGVGPYGAGSGSCVALNGRQGGGGGRARGNIPVTPGQQISITVGGGGGGGCGRNRQGGWGCCGAGGNGVVYLSW